MSAGTENVAGIAGLGAAAATALKKLDAEGARLAALRDRLEQAVLAAVPGTAVNGALTPRRSNQSDSVSAGRSARLSNGHAAHRWQR